MDSRLRDCPDWPEQPKTWMQSIVGLWITEAKEAFDECKADLKDTHKTLDDARIRAKAPTNILPDEK